MRTPKNIDPARFDPDVLAEHRLVLYTLRRLDEEDRLSDVRREQEAFDDPGLTLRALHAVLPLPIRLCRGRFSAATTKVQASGSVRSSGGNAVPGQVAHLATHFATSAIGREYLRQRRIYSSPTEVPVGMVFPCARIPGGLILHDGQFSTPLPTIIPIDSRGNTVRLEWYREVLKAIAAGDRGDRQNSISAAAAAHASAIVASIRTRLGVGVAGRLAIFLAGHQVGCPGPLHYQRVQVVDGTPWVVMTMPGLGTAVTASPRGVQAAVAELKGKGLLDVRRGGFAGDGCRNGYRLVLDEFSHEEDTR